MFRLSKANVIFAEKSLHWKNTKQFVKLGYNLKKKLFENQKTIVHQSQTVLIKLMFIEYEINCEKLFNSVIQNIQNKWLFIH